MVHRDHDGRLYTLAVDMIGDGDKTVSGRISGGMAGVDNERKMVQESEVLRGRRWCQFLTGLSTACHERGEEQDVSGDVICVFLSWEAD